MAFRNLPLQIRKLKNLRFLSAKPPQKSKKLRFLVVDGYAKEGRAELEGGGATTAGILYRNMLNDCSPAGAVSDIIYPSDADCQVPDPSAYDGVAWTGCSLTIYNTADERVTKQLKLAEQVYSRQIPQFGSCWSAQIAATAAGGVCQKNPKGREMGIARKIQLTTEGRAHPMFEGKPTVFDAFISHDDCVVHMPPVSQCLASNNWTSIQALAVTHKGGQFWAVQYHPEYDLHELARLTFCRIKKLMGIGYFRSEAEGRQYVDDLEALFKDSSRKDIAWRLGIDNDVISADIRQVEVRNWIRKLVLPTRDNS